MSGGELGGELSDERRLELPASLQNEEKSDSDGLGEPDRDGGSSDDEPDDELTDERRLEPPSLGSDEKPPSDGLGEPDRGGGSSGGKAGDAGSDDVRPGSFGVPPPFAWDGVGAGGFVDPARWVEFDGWVGGVADEPPVPPGARWSAGAGVVGRETGVWGTSFGVEWGPGAVGFGPGSVGR